MHFGKPIFDRTADIGKEQRAARMVILNAAFGKAGITPGADGFYEQ